MSQATHLYFDHPQEPSPEERGFYWATRYTDTKKAFYFQPDDLWANVDITRFGEPLTLSTVCGDNNVGCPSLVKRENVVGESGLCLKSERWPGASVTFGGFFQCLNDVVMATHHSSYLLHLKCRATFVTTDGTKMKTNVYVIVNVSKGVNIHTTC